LRRRAAIASIGCGTAYETHFVRRVDVLAVPRPPGHRVLAGADRRFWNASELIEPVTAHGPRDDCLELVAKADGRERFGEADSTDLRASEFVDVTFDRAPGGSTGVVIDCRQTLLTTYLLYQAFAYMGTDVGHWLAEIERGNVAVGDGFVTDYLGCIDVQVADASGRFVDAGSVCEYGPIARDTHVIALDDAARRNPRAPCHDARQLARRSRGAGRAGRPRRAGAVASRARAARRSRRRRRTGRAARLDARADDTSGRPLRAALPRSRNR
jgi:hypothetical protein